MKSKALLFSTAALVAASTLVHASDGTWNGGTGNWNTTDTNWTGVAAGTPWDSTNGSTNKAIFGGTGGTVSLTSGVFANALQFDTTGYTISGANTLTLAGTTPTITTGTGVTATISSVISGGAGLTKAGTGTLSLTGANNYTGGTFITDGTLQIGNGTVNGTMNGTFDVSSGATLRYWRAADVTSPTWGNVTGAGVFAVMTNRANNGTNTAWGTQLALSTGFTGTLQIERGRVHGTSSNLGGATAVKVLSGAQFLLVGSTFSNTQNFIIAGTGYGEGGQEVALRFSNNAAAVTLNGNVTLSGDAAMGAQANATINGVVSGGYNLTFGAGFLGAVMTLNNANNSYSGNTTINNGTLQIGGSGRLGSGAYAGNIAINNTRTFQFSSSADQAISGIISGTGSLVKDTGAGTLTLSNVNTYSGATTVSAGNLTVSGQINIKDATNGVSIASGSTLAVTGTLKLLGKTIGTGVIANAGTLDLSSATDTLDLGGLFTGLTDGQTYKLMSSVGTISGNFDSITNLGTAGFTAALNTTNGILTFTAVPEPSTYGLIGAGALAGVAFVRRRRKHTGKVAA